MANISESEASQLTELITKKQYSVIFLNFKNNTKLIQCANIYLSVDATFPDFVLRVELKENIHWIERDFEKAKKDFLNGKT